MNGRQIPKVRMSWRFVMLFLWLVFGSRSRFTKLRRLLIAGDVLDANDMLATVQRWRHSEELPVYHCNGAARGAAPSIPRVHSSHRVRRSGPITWCTIRGGPTAQTAALRCVNVAQEHVPLTQGASIFVSWSSAAIRLLELGCWMQLSPCKKFC